MEIIDENPVERNYIEILKNAIRDKKNSIDYCDQLLGLSNDLPESTIVTIEKLKNDNEDHLVILKTLLFDECEEKFSIIVNEDDDSAGGKL